MEREPERRTFVGYHGTSILAVPSVLTGVAQSVQSNFAVQQLGLGFYVTDDYPTAVVFARVAARRLGGVPFVVNIYGHNFAQLTGQEVAPAWWWRIADDSPLITDFDYLTAQVVGYPGSRQIKFNPRAYHTLAAEISR